MDEQMSKDVVCKRILEIVSDMLQKSVNELSPNMTVFSDLDIESVEIMEIDFMIEQEFGVKIGKDELWNLPNYILEKGLFSDGLFSGNAITLIKENFSSITEENITQIKNVTNLLQFFTLGDIVERIYKKISSVGELNSAAAV